MSVHYGSYLQLDTLLNSQDLKSQKETSFAFDEHLFIITHQSIELWFKQYLFELKEVVAVFSQNALTSNHLGDVKNKLRRLVRIQKVLLQSMEVLETMTPMDFLEFRDFLIPASGFQSIQFKEIDILCGKRFSSDDYHLSALKESERSHLLDIQKQPSLSSLVQKWLERMPFLDTEHFDFMNAYQTQLETLYTREKQLSDKQAVQDQSQINRMKTLKNDFESLFDEDKFKTNHLTSPVSFSRGAMLSAIFIYLYRDHVPFDLPFEVLTLLVDIDENWIKWRMAHLQLVQRTIGMKMGTGGSGGAAFLQKSLTESRCFPDLIAVPSFLVSRQDMPKLPDQLINEMARAL